MIPVYAAKLGLTSKKTSVKAQKIDGLPLETHGMALARFLFQNCLEMVWFLEETFLQADIFIEMVLRMSFLVLNNADFQLDIKALVSKTYTIAEALPNMSQVELINMREFVNVAINENSKTFVVHISALKITKSLIHPFQAAQIAAL